MSVYTKLACFAGGALFGSFGVKLLSSKDAKKAYVHVTAAGLRMKDSVILRPQLADGHIHHAPAGSRPVADDVQIVRIQELRPVSFWRQVAHHNH